MLNILQQAYIFLGPFLITSFLGFSVIALLWWHSSRKHEYWKKVGIPYAKPTPLIGSVRDNIKKPVHETELERYQEYGRIYGLYEGTTPVLSIGDRELLRQILVKDFHAFTGRRNCDMSPSKKARRDVSTIERPTIPQPAPSGINSKDLKKSLNCPLCDSKFQRKNHFFRHMRWHESHAASSSGSSMEISEDEALPEVRTVECQPEALQSSDNEVEPERTTTKERSELAGASTHSLPVFDRIAGKMLQFLQGEDWKRVRTIVTPTFTTGKIKRMLGIFKECSETLVQNFRETAKKGEPINAKNLYSAFTMDVIASSAFSTKIDSHNDPNNEFLQYARTVFGGNLNWKFIIYLIFPWLIKLFRVSLFPQKGVDFFAKVTLQIIEERQKTGKTRNDFLQLLLDTAKETSEDSKTDTDIKDDIDENYGKDENDQIFKQTSYKKKTLSHNELIAQCIIFFLAGYETSAATLAFASYCLALNPDVQEKLIEEIDRALSENNGELTYEAVQDMKYLNNVISETLRIYPPAIRLERIADEDYKLADTGIVIPKDMLVYVPVYAMHRDPKLYPDPEKFDPDRFTPEERAKRDQYAYLPFGHGPRNCVGMRFALMEIKVCLAHVLSNFRFKRSSKTKVPLEFHIGQGLLMVKEILLDLEERKDKVAV